MNSSMKPRRFHCCRKALRPAHGPAEGWLRQSAVRPSGSAPWRRVRATAASREAPAMASSPATAMAGPVPAPVEASGAAPAAWPSSAVPAGFGEAAGLDCLCSISCCGFSHDDFSGLGRACRPRNGLNWMVLVSPPERTGKDYDQHAPSTVYPSFAAKRGIRRVDRAENTCRRSRRCVSTSRRRICRPCRR